VNRFGVLPRLNELKVATRISIGFGIAFALVLALAVLGLVSLQGVTRTVGSFTATADVAQTAADADIGMRDLDATVHAHLADGDPETLADARARHQALLGRLDALARSADAADAPAIDSARGALDRYWQGFEQLVKLGDERMHLLNSVLVPMVAQMSTNLGQLRDAGGADSAAIAAESAMAVLLMQDHAARYVGGRDPKDAQAMREALENAGTKLLEMNRFLWVQGTRQLIADTRHLMQGSGGVLDRLEELQDQDEQLRSEALAPNAAEVSAKAAEVRAHAGSAAATLQRGLGDGTAGWVNAALWVGAMLLVAGLLAAWVVVRSVARPVDAMANAMTALAEGRPATAAVPALSGRDEIATMARAVQALRAHADEVERQKREASALHAELAAAKERAEAKDLAKTDFLVNMGQELHRPLNDIIHHSQSLMGELHRLGAGELATDVEMIQWSGEQLVGLVDAILDYAKIEAGAVDVCVQDFDIGRLLAEVRERALPQADLNGNTLTVAAPAGLGSMQQDFGKVRQMLMNLLDNACKFTRNGTITLSAERTERDGRPHLRFAVTDTGAGFVPSQAGRLFQPFVQGSAPGGGKLPGAGLGLTLVGHYTAMLGGDIEVASEPGQGTRIALTLPVVYEAPAEDRPLPGPDGIGMRPLLSIAPRALPRSAAE